jgi:hypothetical protein
MLEKTDEQAEEEKKMQNRQLLLNCLHAEVVRKNNHKTDLHPNWN